MKINEKGLNLLKGFENLSLKPYLDSVGKPTIGYGCTFYQNRSKVLLTDPEITQQDAEDLLNFNLRNLEINIEKAVKVSLTENQFSSLVCFAYNIGLYHFENSTLLKLINQEKFDLASDEFLKWVFANHIELAGLYRRRKAEQFLFNSIK